MPIALIHAPQPPAVPSTTASDSRDYQSSAQVTNSILTAQNAATHGLTGATTGDILVAISPTVLGVISAPAAGQLLVAQGVGALPSWNANLTVNAGGFVTAVQFLIAASVGNVWSSGGFQVASGSYMAWSTRSIIQAPADGTLTLNNNASTTGSRLKFDALPTIASGFGTGPSITAGSTPLAGSVNVGTGGVATSGVINFNGTAFPSAPFVVCMNTTTGAVVRATTTTTQLTITAPAVFNASDVISWVCISSF